jgi:non-heme chloroperoxidase
MMPIILSLFLRSLPLFVAPLPWHDPSPHRVQFVSIEEGVSVEVLDWGGSGRNLVLLAGSGNTAHVFDDFAPKLMDCCHVYGITRRGFGASSHPESGYDDQRLADDVLQVLDKLRIDRPVLIGHSMAGREMTTLGNQHSDRLAGLVYLDALADPKDWSGDDPGYVALFNKLPEPMRGSPRPSAEEIRSFALFQKWQLRANGFAFPESELRNMYETNDDGTKGRFKTPNSVNAAIDRGSRKRDYSKIRVPGLAIIDAVRSSNDPPPPNEYKPKNASEGAAIEAYNAATRVFVERWKNNFKREIPGARVVDLVGAGHYVFLTREAEVLHAIQVFIATLK